MTITEKDVENTNGTKTKKKWKKIILIVLAVWIGLGIIGSLVTDLLDDEKTESKSIEAHVQDKKADGASNNREIYPLLFSDFVFGCNKDELIKTLKDKGWIVTQSYKESDELDLALDFSANGIGMFQGHISNEIIASFDKDGKFQQLNTFLDIRPEVLSYQGFTDIKHKIQKVSDECLIYQGYNEFEERRKENMRSYMDSEGSTAILWLHDLGTEKAQMYISYYSPELFKRMTSK